MSQRYGLLRYQPPEGLGDGVEASHIVSIVHIDPDPKLKIPTGVRGFIRIVGGVEILVKDDPIALMDQYDRLVGKKPDRSLPEPPRFADGPEIARHRDRPYE